MKQNGLSIMVYHPNNTSMEKKESLKIYLNKNSTPGSLKLYNGEKIDASLINYELRNGIFTIKNSYNDSIKLIQGHLVKEFKTTHIAKKIFLNGKEFNHNSYPPIFGESLTGGKHMLLRIPEVIRLRANYNVITNSGSKEDKLMLKHKLYYYDGSRLIQVKGSKKRITDLFINKKEEVKDYIKKNKLSVKKETDLIKIFEYYNSIT